MVGSTGTVAAGGVVVELVGVGTVLLLHLRRRGEAEERARAEKKANRLFDCIVTKSSLFLE